MSVSAEDRSSGSWLVQSTAVYRECDGVSCVQCVYVCVRDYSECDGVFCVQCVRVCVCVCKGL